MDNAPKQVLEFEGFTLDLSRGCLRNADGEIRLRPKSFELLRVLAQNPGRLLQKDELLSAVWPDVTVTEEALAHCVSEVRRALSDRGQVIIKTVPRRGYLFACAVKRETADIPEERPNRALALPDKPSIAVLPFTNLGADAEQEYLADGIVEDIITELSRFSELFVIARNSSFQYKGKATDVRQVGRDLGVRYVLEGSVRRGGDRLRISAQLIDAATGTHRWAERYDRKLADVFAVQDEVVGTIAAILAAHVRKAETERARACRRLKSSSLLTRRSACRIFTRPAVSSSSRLPLMQTTPAPMPSWRARTSQRGSTPWMAISSTLMSSSKHTNSRARPFSSIPICPWLMPSLDMS
jgi:TolB-like protein